MIPVLDTSIMVSLEKGNKKVIHKLKEISMIYQAPAVISFITYFEFLLGIKDRNFRNQEGAMEFINKFGVLKISRKTAQILSDLKYKYDKIGKTMPLADYLITAQVIENNMILVTTDRDFKKIEEMKKIII